MLDDINMVHEKEPPLEARSALRKFELAEKTV